MKRTLIALSVSGALALGTLGAFAQAPEHALHHGHGMGHGKMGDPMEHLTKDLDLTADQQAKVQPIIDQAKPQFQAIHHEAMEKARALMESTGAQIRPLLTPEQQAKFDAMKKAHEDMIAAAKEMKEARGE